jgi:hypothetical protein
MLIQRAILTGRIGDQDPCKKYPPIFEEFVQRGTVTKDAFKANTPWKTNEFGFFDLNKNAIFIMEDID